MSINSIRNVPSTMGSSLFSTTIREENDYYATNPQALIKRYKEVKELDFLSEDNTNIHNGDILTNPPFKLEIKIIKKALSLLNKGSRLYIFMPISYLSSVSRFALFKEFPPKILYISVKRLTCAMNGDLKTIQQELLITLGIFGKRAIKASLKLTGLISS